MLRRKEETEFADHFGFRPLDRLVQVVTETRPSKLIASPPVIELTSIAPGGGKTHLLYHLIAKGVLPHQLGGKQASVVVIATENTFSIPRLAQHIHLQITTQTAQSTTEDNEENTQRIKDTLLTALTHTHFFRPQTLPSLIATLHSLPTYLFNPTAHKSLDRRLAFIALDSASAFYWQARADSEHAAYIASTKDSSNQPRAQSATPSNTTYAGLTSALKKMSSVFECPILLTTQNLAPLPAASTTEYGGEVRALRPALPAPLAHIPILRLIVQRVKVRKLPVGISAEEARQEAENRQRVVDEGRFECVVNEWDLDERTLQRMQQVRAGFGFRIRDEGVLFDD